MDEVLTINDMAVGAAIVAAIIVAGIAIGEFIWRHRSF